MYAKGSFWPGQEGHAREATDYQSKAEELLGFFAHPAPRSSDAVLARFYDFSAGLTCLLDNGFGVAVDAA